LPAADVLSVQVVDSQNSAALVFISDESETQTLAGLVVPGQAAVDDFTKLRSDGDYVTLVHSEWQTLNRDVSR
jgi:hypothetical protein